MSFSRSSCVSPGSAQEEAGQVPLPERQGALAVVDPGEPEVGLLAAIVDVGPVLHAGEGPLGVRASGGTWSWEFRRGRPGSVQSHHPSIPRIPGPRRGRFRGPQGLSAGPGMPYDAGRDRGGDRPPLGTNSHATGGRHHGESTNPHALDPAGPGPGARPRLGGPRGRPRPRGVVGGEVGDDHARPGDDERSPLRRQAGRRERGVPQRRHPRRARSSSPAGS